MIDRILRSDKAVTLVGGGAMEPGDLDLALKHAPELMAADSGAGEALAAGHMPLAVVGDFDSLVPEDAARIPPERLFHIAEQDSTDFEKALSRVAAPLVLAVGFMGARLDHKLATLNCLVRLANQPCILIGQRELVFHVPPRITLDLVAGDTVSLFPMTHVTGRSEGLEWPIDGLAFSPAGQVGTSNRALGPVSLETSGPGLVGLVPKIRIEDVIAAFRSRPGGV